MKAWWLKKAAAVVAMTVVTILALGGVVMVLWNAVVPDVSGAPPLTYWQGVALLLLTQILLRGVGRWRAYQHPSSRDQWKHKFEEKLASMAPEERERFKAEWDRRCGCGSEHKAESQKQE
ncbi:MAG: hypothetical protein MUE68_06880 [Bacteroidetes bacterium]|jgi:hypothetical protein|nr:hypothetical protein [Bacteroidota bacterium]